MGLNIERSIRQHRIEQAVDMKSPYNIVFDAAESLKRVPQEMDGARMRRLKGVYIDWATAMQESRAVIRLVPLDEELERHLFGVFCGQLRTLGVKIVPAEEQTAFTWFIED